MRKSNERMQNFILSKKDARRLLEIQSVVKMGYPYTVAYDDRQSEIENKSNQKVKKDQKTEK